MSPKKNKHTGTEVVRFDYAIKTFLRNKANFDVLEGFLSELLRTDIKIETLLESESNQDSKENKFNRVDVLAQTDKGKVIIEVQVHREVDYLSRILFGTSKVITEYMKKGEKYHNLQKVYSVSILYFDLGEGSDYIYKGTTEFRGIHTREILGLKEKEKAVYQHKVETPAEIYPEYYLVKINQFRDKIKEKLDEWMYFFKNEVIKPEFTAKGLDAAREKLDVSRMDKQKRQAYNRYLMDLSYEASLLDSSYMEGLVEGQAKAKAAEKKAKAAERKAAAVERKAEAEKQKAKAAEQKAKAAEQKAAAVERKAEAEKRAIAIKLEASGMDKASIQAITGITTW